jgi:hypothetical protein
LQDLEILEEIQTLSDKQLALRADLKKELLDLYETHELSWYSKSSERWNLTGITTLSVFIE